MIHLSLQNLYFYSIRSKTVFESSKQGKFQSVQTNLNYFLLLTYSHSQSSQSYYLIIIVCLKRASFLFLCCWSSPMVWWFYNFHGCALPHSWVGYCDPVQHPFQGCQGSCGIVPNGLLGLVVSFNIHQRLNCKHEPSTPTVTLWLLCSNYTLLWNTKFLGVFSKTDTMYTSSTLSWIWCNLLNFLEKCINF